MEEMFHDFVRNRRLCSLNSVILFKISVVLFRGEHFVKLVDMHICKH